MKIASVLLLIGSTHLTGWAAAPALPKDVITFLDERESCDHWRGEEGYDQERKADINWYICHSCSGTDANLAHLKKKYRSEQAVMGKLGELEPQIEPADKVKTQRYCRTTRKPERSEE